MDTFVAVSPGAGTNQPLTKHRATYKRGYNPQLNYALSNEEKSLFDLIFISILISILFTFFKIYIAITPPKLN